MMHNNSQQSQKKVGSYSQLYTLPFLAAYLYERDYSSFNKRIHAERYDIESLFYYMCWIACRYSGGKQVRRKFDSWNSREALRRRRSGKKNDFMYRLNSLYDVLSDQTFDDIIKTSRRTIVDHYDDDWESSSSLEPDLYEKFLRDLDPSNYE